jgi:hypothetical protein
MLAVLQGQAQRTASEFVKADGYAQRAFEAQVKYHENGTASLADLATTWRQRDALHRQMQTADLKPPGIKQQAANFGTLSQLADRVTDRRGRNAADVTMVHALGVLRDLNTVAERPIESATK